MPSRRGGPITDPSDLPPEEYFAGFNLKKDAEINLAQAALKLAEMRQPDIKAARYYHHIEMLVREVRERFNELITAGAENDASTRLAALKHIIADKHAYKAQKEGGEALEGASLIRAIEKRCGRPEMLAILYMQAAHERGWTIEALDFPGYLLCRLDHKGQRVIFRPDSEVRVLEAASLREMLKKTLGGNAELKAAYFEPLSSRAVLIRLHNLIKSALIETENYAEALEAVDVMRLIDPGEYRLLLDEGVLSARCGQNARAVDALKDYIERAPSAQEKREAALLMRSIEEEQKGI